MTTSGPYVRVYYSIWDDSRFDSIRDNDRHLATWLRLLMAADAVWPASAMLPVTARKPSLTALVGAGLVEILPGHRFRLHGLDGERERRRARATQGATARWSHSDSSATALRTHSDGNAIDMPRAAAEQEQEQEQEHSTREASDNDGRADLEAWLLIRHRAPTPRQRSFLDAYCATFDVTGPARAERLILAHPDDPIDALKADLDAFRRERLSAAQAAERKPTPVPRRSNGLTGINAELAALLREDYGEAPA